MYADRGLSHLTTSMTNLLPVPLSRPALMTEQMGRFVAPRGSTLALTIDPEYEFEDFDGQYTLSYGVVVDEDVLADGAGVCTLLSAPDSDDLEVKMDGACTYLQHVSLRPPEAPSAAVPVHHARVRPCIVCALGRPGLDLCRPRPNWLDERHPVHQEPFRQQDPGAGGAP